MKKNKKQPVSLHPHQLQAFNSVITAIKDGNGSAVGRVVMPTGAGKTFVEAAILDYQIANNTKTRIHLVLAPRIMLANQLIEEFRKFSGPSYRAIAFHSGTHEPEYEKIKWQEKSTTRYEVVVDEYTKSINKNQDLVVFSTYHSCGKLKLTDFDTIIADESQYAVAEGFHEAVKSLSARVKLFFTATEKHTASSKGRGLNNESVYGKRLFTIKPAELIQLGLIVAPRLHIMYGETDNSNNSVVDEVIQLTKGQDDLTRPEMGFSKILFAMKGTGDVKTIIDNRHKLQALFPDHDIFTITSKTGAMINGVEVQRNYFMRELRNNKRKNVLIFHYDILSEGIDVDGITGVVIMRNMGLAKLQQTIGRAIRIYKPDPSLKKQAWISISVINGNEDDMAHVRDTVKAIRNGGYDISAEDVVETSKPAHQGDEVGVDDAVDVYKTNYSNLFIESVFHDIETNEFWEDLNSKSDTEVLEVLF